MSIDTHAEHDAHGGHDGGHHEPPEVVDGRQRMAIWLFIGGDIITTAALLFTYLYLRGVNTGGHWMSMLGYPGPQMAGGHTYAWYQNAASLADPTNVMVGKLAAGLNWTVTLLTVLSALIIWGAEKALRSSKNAKNYSMTCWVAVLVTVVAIVLSFKQLQSIPQIYVAVNDSQTMSYTTYDSSMMVIVGSAVVHLFLLAFLGVGLAIRSARGVINGDKWYQARLVRLFWVWVGVSAIVVSATTTFINVVH
jgi:heme/copper-type cytochrome/quinol oxidase subunit 3